MYSFSIPTILFFSKKVFSIKTFRNAVGFVDAIHVRRTRRLHYSRYDLSADVTEYVLTEPLTRVYDV